MTTWNRLGWVLVLVLCFTPVGHAQETIETWRQVVHTTAHHAMPVGDVKDHTIGVMEQQGLAFFDRDEVATLVVNFTYEHKQGKRSVRGHVRYTFTDGSTRTATFTGNGSAPGEQEGTITFIQGSGRFKGIAGHGTWTAVTFPTDSQDTYLEVTASHTCITEC